MRGVLTALLGGVLVLANLSAADWSGAVKAASASVMYVESHAGSCTAFVIDTTRKYALTAAHCEPENDADTLWVDRVRAKVISKDTQKDLLVLEIPDMDPKHTALALAAANPKIGDDVMSVGYGEAFETPMFRQAHVSNDTRMIPYDGIGGPLIEIDAAFVPGQSGGPVINRLGEVVSIVQRGSDRFGVGVGAAILRERTGRFWAATK